MSQKLALLGGTPVRRKPFTSWPIFGKAEEKRLLRTLHSGKWGRLDGSEVAEFEDRFAAQHGCRHGIAVVNGTVSLRIALLAAGIRAEDEVIIPPSTSTPEQSKPPLRRAPGRLSRSTSRDNPRI